MIKGGTRLTLIATAVAVGAAMLMSRLWEKVYYPWDDASNGPPITATWVGSLRTGSGSPRAVIFVMRRRHPKRGRVARCPQCGAIIGTATTCDALGQLRDYRISGTPDDRHASRVHVSTIPVTQPPPDGLELSTVRGAWAGDSLHLEAEFHWRKGTSAISNSADPDTRGWVPLEMTRGTESDFRARCASVTSR